MKTICAMRDVFKAMGNFETAFEKMYQITLNEAMIIVCPQRGIGESDGYQPVQANRAKPLTHI